MVKEKEASSAVKIDTNLLKRVEDFIIREENRLKYNNKKQFINIAVHEFLEKMLKEGKTR
jgi:hypothetical protein